VHGEGKGERTMNNRTHASTHKKWKRRGGQREKKQPLAEQFGSAESEP